MAGAVGQLRQRSCCCPPPPKHLLRQSNCDLQVKEEGWWLVLSDASDGELLALKRVSFAGERATTRLAFPPNSTFDGEPHAQLRLRLVSDSYLGVDQSFAVAVGGGEAAAAAPP